MNRKRLIIPAILALLVSCSTDTHSTTRLFEKEQLYKGYSNSGGYLCYLKISPDNTVLFTYETKGNAVYGEHTGKITAVNDSTFHVNCKLTFGQFICMAFSDDSLEITVSPETLLDKQTIQVQYDNEELMNKRKIDRFGVLFPFDKELFNRYHPAFILTDHLHPITGEALTIEATYGSGYEFLQGDEVSFDIVLSGDSLYTVREDDAFQTGPFRLKKQRK
jgi:hypothetical protein